MSRFFSQRYKELTPYVPGEQPLGQKYIKLNTNESPYPVSAAVRKAVAHESGRIQLYSDPQSRELTEKMAEILGVGSDNVVMTNGSDEALNFAFMAFADEERPLAFADITYGFYDVFAKLNRIPYVTLPLKDDFTIDASAYMTPGRTAVIANPNAPTGIKLPLEAVESIAAANRENIVIIDEAYVDFSGESAVGLTKTYDNLLVIQTFSKSRSMAGARLGMAVGNRTLIEDINILRYSTNPYNVNRLTSAAGIAVLEDNDYYMSNCKRIVRTREKTTQRLRERGFTVLDSAANFVFAKSDRIEGGALYRRLKDKGILIRHFDKSRISNFNRITIGSDADMDKLIEAIDTILKEMEA